MPDELGSHFRLTRKSFDCLSLQLHSCKTYNKPHGPAVDPIRDILRFLWYIDGFWKYTISCIDAGISHLLYYVIIRHLQTFIRISEQ